MQSKWASHHSYYLFLFWITIICVAIFYLPPDDGVHRVYGARIRTVFEQFSPYLVWSKFWFCLVLS